MYLSVRYRLSYIRITKKKKPKKHLYRICWEGNFRGLLVCERTTIRESN